MGKAAAAGAARSGLIRMSVWKIDTGNGIGNSPFNAVISPFKTLFSLYAALKGPEGAAKGQDDQEDVECRAAWAAWPGKDAGLE